MTTPSRRCAVEAFAASMAMQRAIRAYVRPKQVLDLLPKMTTRLSGIIQSQTDG
jgi:hypothetical protein